MTPLVSLQEALDQISGAQTEEESRIETYSQLATGIVMYYVGLNDPTTGAARDWTQETVPDAVKASILLVLAKLWAHRGDEEPKDGYLSPHVCRLLDQYREPVVA